MLAARNKASASSSSSESASTEAKAVEKPESAGSEAGCEGGSKAVDKLVVAVVALLGRCTKSSIRGGAKLVSESEARGGTRTDGGVNGCDEVGDKDSDPAGGGVMLAALDRVGVGSSSERIWALEVFLRG